MKIQKTAALSALGLALFAAGFTATYAAKPATNPRATAESAIRAADAAWVKTAESAQLDGFLSFYSDDAVALPDNGPLTTGKEPLRKLLAGFFTLPGFSLTWKAATVEAARSGEMGYSRGAYVLTMNDANGNPMTQHGKFVEVWKKQSDGSWKCAVDIFNDDAVHVRR